MITRRPFLVLFLVAIPLCQIPVAADRWDDVRAPFSRPQEPRAKAIACDRDQHGVWPPDAASSLARVLADAAAIPFPMQGRKEASWKGTVTVMKESSQRGVNPGTREPWKIESNDTVTCTVVGPDGKATCRATTKYRMSAADGTFLIKEATGTDDAIVTVSLTAKGTVVDVSAVRLKGTMKTPWGGGAEEFSLGPFTAQGPPTADDRHTTGSWSPQVSPELLKAYDILKHTITWDLSRQ